MGEIADRNVIRQDVIEISYEVDSNPFRGITDEISELRRAMGVTDNLTESIRDITRATNTTEEGLNDVVTSARRLGNTDANRLLGDVDDLNTGAGRAAQSSDELLEKLSAVGQLGLSTAVKGLKNIAEQATGAGAAIAKGLGKATVSAAKGVTAGIVTAGGAAATGIGAAMVAATEKTKAVNSALAQTGYNKEDYGKEFGDIMSNLYRDNMGEDYADLGNSIAQVAQISGTTGESLQGLTHNALLMRDTFDFEVTESTRSAKMMMDQFGISGNEAYSLIAQGAQSGLNKNDDLLDTLNEYGTHFQQMGFDSTEMMNMLVNGASSGTFSVDKLGDSVKEFGIRSKDGSDGTMQAFKDIGLNAQNLTNDFAAGGEKGKAAFQQVTSALAGMTDPVKQNAAGVALFGTMWEDLGAEGVLAMAQLTGSITGGEEALKKLNEVKYDDLGSAFAGIKRIITDGLIGPISELFLPAANEMAEELKGFATSITDIFADGIQAGDMDKVAGVLGEMLTKGISTLSSVLPQVVTVGSSILFNLISGIQANAGMLAGCAASTVTQLLTGIIEIMPMALLTGTDLILSFIQGISGALPCILQSGATAFQNFTNGIVSRMPMIVQTALALIVNFTQGLLQNIPTIISSGVTLLLSLLQGIISALPYLAESALSIIESLVQGLSANLPSIIQTGIQLLLNLILGIVSMLPALVQMGLQLIVSLATGLLGALPTLISQGVNIILSLINGIVTAIPMIIDTMVGMVPVLASAFISNLPIIIQAGYDIIFGLLGGILKAAPMLLSMSPRIFYALFETIISIDWLGLGKKILNSIKDGLLGGWKDILGIGKEKGKETAESFAAGAEAGKPTITAAANGIADAAKQGLSAPNASSYGNTIPTDFTTGINSGLPAVNAAATGIPIAATTGLQGGNASGYGNQFAASYNSGIMSGVPMVGATTTGMVNNATAGLQPVGVAEQGVQFATSYGSGIESGAAGLDTSAMFMSSTIELEMQSANGNASGYGNQFATSYKDGIMAGIPMVDTAVSSLTGQVKNVEGTEVSIKVNADVEALDTFNSKIKEIVDNTNATLQKIPEDMGKVLAEMNTAASTQLTNLATTFTTKFGEILSITQTSMLSVVSAVSSVNLTQTGQNLMNGLKNGILSKKQDVISAAKDIAKGVGTAMNEALDIHSPSRVTFKTGEFAALGAEKGMEAKTKAVTDTAWDMGHEIAGGVEKGRDSYTPENTTYNKSYAPVNNTSNANFNVTIQGGTEGRSTERQVKKWMKESIDEYFKSMGRVNPQLSEV